MRRHLSAVTAAALLAGGLATAVAPPASAATTSRIAGSDRYATAASVSASHFAPGVPVAFLATGEGFPDALAGGPAAAALGGPVLLVGRDRLPAPTADELARLRPGRLVVLGGPGAVSDAVVRELQSRTAGSVTRLSGPDRYATAAAISQAAFAPGVETVYVTTGTAFADALPAGAAAGSRKAPVLLTAPGTLPAATADELTRLRPASITVLGGAAAVWPAVEEALRARTSGAVTRLSGADRYATSAAVSRATFRPGVPAVFLATGTTFPDALSGGPVAALTPGPLLLAQSGCLPPSVRAEIDRLAPRRVVLLGGAGALGSGAESGAVCASGAALGPQGSGGPARTTVVEAPDYASEAFGDPWDYSNPEDVHTGTPQMSDGGTIANGRLTYVTATQWPWMDPLPYLPGSMPLERDGPSAPVDTARYTHLTVRMYASQASAAQLSWSTCDWSRDRACSGAMGVSVRAGWHAYTWKIAPNSSLTAPWAGKALQVRWLPSTHQGATIVVDDLRVHSMATPPVRFTFAPAAGGTNEVYWDADASQANNTADSPGWGRLGTSSDGTYDFPVSTFGPGSYRLYARSGGAVGPYTEPLTIVPRPRPVIDSPGLAGGDDYATSVRRDAWDFSSMGDVGKRDNVCNARILDGGVLAANNCGPEIDNPWFDLPIPGPITGDDWHRLTVRLRYDGPFGLTGGPTGGAVARLIWYVNGTPADQNVHDLVVYPGWQEITVDLKTNPSSAVVDESQRGVRVGWAGQTISRVRLDPNEDVSERRWYVDFVRLSRDVRAPGGTFDLDFRETSGLPGQTATVFLDRDRSGADGARVATKAVAPGSNRVRVTAPASFGSGSYWPYVVVDGPGGRTVRYAKSPVVVRR